MLKGNFDDFSIVDVFLGLELPGYYEITNEMNLLQQSEGN